MNFDLVKVVRVRPSIPSEDERLSVVSNGPYKGSISDIRLELHESRKKFKIYWIPIAQSNNTPYSVEYLKDDFIEFGNSAYDKVIEKEIISGASRIIAKLGLQKKAEDYYSIIQDPWKDEPPLQRNYGFDSYFLNNGSEIFIKWFESDGVTTAGGLVWSNDDGSESKVRRGSTFSLVSYGGLTIPKFDETEKASLIKRVEFRYKDDSFMISDEQIKKFSLDLKDQNFSGNILDSDIIDKVIFLWSKNVPNYDLKLCEPSYYPTITLDYISPLSAPPETKPTDDNKPPSTDNVENRKIKLNCVWDTNAKIKAKEDIPTINVYFGDVPKTPEYVFGSTDEFDDLRLLDDEYVEDSYQGSQESFENVDSWTPEKAAKDAEVLKNIENKNNVVITNNVVSTGKWEIDAIPGEFVTNSGVKIKCCVIDGAPVNLSIAGKFLDMQAAAAKDGISISINSGFRSPYDSISASAPSGYRNGKKVGKSTASASSQKSLYDLYLAGKGNLAAKPGQSNHGNGIALDLNAGGDSCCRYSGVNEKIYEWLVKNSWKYGFVRAVAKEEWHYDFRPDVSANGPYAVLSAKDKGKVDTKFYNKKKDGSYWGLDEIKIS